MNIEGKILKLFGVKPCGVCAGLGLSPGPYVCSHCSGQGYSLQDAGREEWPWWSPCSDIHLHGYEKTHELCQHQPLMPAFETNGDAAVKLAERLSLGRSLMDDVMVAFSRDGIAVSIGWQTPQQFDRVWASGPTLGAALLAALGAQED